MFEEENCKTLPQVVVLLVQALLFEIMVCGLVNALGARLTSGSHGSLLSAAIHLGVFLVTGLLLASNASSLTMSFAAFRDDRMKEYRPLARIAAPLVLVQSGFLFALYLLDARINLI